MRFASIAVGLLTALSISTASAEAGQPDPWPDLVINVFDGRAMEDGSSVLSLEAPYRAEDAAVVPLTIRAKLPAESGLRIEKITLVIDNNPSPVAAEFVIGPERRVHEISTRMRVDAYTNIHAVAELSDGKLYSVAKFVKASGGCSAPAVKSPEGVAGIGEIRFREIDTPVDASTGVVEAQVMIRHPNNSGLQREPLTNYYIPAYFVRDLTVRVGEDLLFRMEGGISISENPTFRFTFDGAGAEPVTVEAIDTKDAVFTGSWPAAGADAT
jgi:sulfur-oxidizing protein SoxY